MAMVKIDSPKHAWSPPNRVFTYLRYLFLNLKSKSLGCIFCLWKAVKTHFVIVLTIKSWFYVQILIFSTSNPAGWNFLLFALITMVSSTSSQDKNRRFNRRFWNSYVSRNFRYSYIVWNLRFNLRFYDLW